MNRLFLVICLLASFLKAQENNFRLDVDYSRFHYSDTSNYVELYYSFDQGIVSIDGKSVPLERDFTVIILNNVKKDTLIKKQYRISPATASTGNSDLLVGVLGFEIPFGEYQCIVNLSDSKNILKGGKVNFILQTRKLIENHFAISDIQLSKNIVQSENTKSSFYKNTFEVTPNPGMVYSEELPVLFYYTELYNLNESGSINPLKLEITVINNENVKISSKSKIIPRKNNSIIEVGTVNLGKLPTNTYRLVLSLVDSVNKKSSSVSKRFYVYAPSIKDTVKALSLDDQYLSSEFATYSSEDLDESFQFGKYVATKQEIDAYKKIQDLEAKRKFLFTFWKNRDKEPSTPENEFKMEYQKRIQYANSKYGSFQKAGWQSDRGRVYLLLGEPDEIVRYPSETDMKPYEIWYYHSVEGGVQFIFGDISGFSEFILLHSDMRGELRDDNWQRRLKAI